MGKHHRKLLNNLEQLRKESGLTQQELSESADVSRKSINAIENGIYIPSTVLALKISKTLECKVEDLFILPKNRDRVREKIIIAQSILWAAAILVVAVAEENNFSIWLLVLLAAVSITYLSRQRF